MEEGIDSNMSALSPPPPPLDCPTYGNKSDHYINEVHWWVEGVFQTTVAIPGLAGKSMDVPRTAFTFLIMWMDKICFL